MAVMKVPPLNFASFPQTKQVSGFKDDGVEKHALRLAVTLCN